MGGDGRVLLPSLSRSCHWFRASHARPPLPKFSMVPEPWTGLGVEWEMLSQSRKELRR